MIFVNTEIERFAGRFENDLLIELRLTWYSMVDFCEILIPFIKHEQRPISFEYGTLTTAY